jgi:subtilase family serine protease
MTLSKALRFSFLAAATALLSQATYGQSFPVVPDTGDGSLRPFVWMVATPNAVHGPGSNCASGCYYYPSDLQRAYATAFLQNGAGGAGRTVAIIDAYHDPAVAANLATFSTTFGLPACGAGCFTQVNQTGGPPSAGFDPGWAVETELDVQWVHAMAPNAHILLVEGNSASFADLGAAVTYARTHADVISNSYGANEFAGEAGLDGFYSGSPVPILFSSGDSGAAGHSYPCASTLVVCVGGTSLFETATSFRAAETGWSGSGGGCSTQIGAPVWQAGFSTALCGAARGMPDIAALADPNTGVLVYLTPPEGGVGAAGFYIIGGTSAACPITAGIVAQIQNARAAAGKTTFTGANMGSSIYTAAGASYHYRFYDVTSGNNGDPAGAGWDQVTGLGVAMGPALTNALIGLP